MSSVAQKTKKSKSRNLYTANRQWAERPSDERFWTLEEAFQVTKGYADISEERTFSIEDEKFEVSANKDDNLVIASGKTPIELTNFSYRQVCRLADAPYDYLAKLPTQLAADCINQGLMNRRKGKDEDAEPKPVKALVQKNGNVLLRSITSEQYTRVWNHEVFSRLIDLQKAGWQVPPARQALKDDPRSRKATEKDVLKFSSKSGLGIKVGDTISPAGIYASDHDMFAFLVNEEYRIDDGSEGGLSRGFFVSNSEVGAGAWKVTLFYYRHVCGNHIVWGAKDVAEISYRHIGNIVPRFDMEVGMKLTEFLESSAKADEQRIKALKSHLLGKDDKEVIEAAYRVQRVSGITMKQMQSALELARQFEEIDGNPYSIWGFGQGLTRLSQQSNYADVRSMIDNYARKLFNLAI